MTSLSGPQIRWFSALLSLALLLSLAATASAAPPEQVIDKLLELAREKKHREPKPGDKELRVLLVRRYNVAVDGLLQRCEDFKQHLATQAVVFQAGRDLLEAELALAEKPDERERILKRALDLVKWYESAQERALKEGIGLRADLLRTQYVRLGLEIDLLKLKGEVNNPNPK